MPFSSAEISQFNCRNNQGLRMSFQELSYELTYSKGSKITIKVNEEGRVHIKVPHGTSQREIERSIEKHRAWIFATQDKIKQSARFIAAHASRAEQEEWKQLMKALVPELVAHWGKHLGVRVSDLAYRNMKSRWGSCNVATGRVCINTRLALYPPQCLEYVVVHELCHLIEANHGPRFYALLEEVLPQWKAAKHILDKT